MLEMIFGYILIGCAFLYIIMTCYGKLFVFRKKEAQFVSDYCATMAAIIGGYALSAILLAIIMPTIHSKLLMIGFGLCPFLIGLIANYHTEKYFTLLQTAILLFSVYYII